MVSVIYTRNEKEINSVVEAMDIVFNHPKNRNPDTVDLQFYYRGHSNIAYDLCPSIARYKHNVKLELSLIEAANYKMPDEFCNENDLLTYLAKMQHYGLPTRLIDFSTNPLVALYFACQNESVDGEVIELNNHVLQKRHGISGFEYLLIEPEILDKPSIISIDTLFNSVYFDHIVVKKLILGIIKESFKKSISVYDYIKKIENEEWFKERMCNTSYFKLPNEEKERTIVALLRCPILLETQEQILRQKLQQGKYLLIPNLVEKTDDGYVIRQKLPKLYKNNCGRWRIKAENKARILEELDMIGINEEFLFGDSIDHICNQMKRKICGTEISVSNW